MISSIITPVRWYNDIFESDRFSIDCDICRFELISDKTRLLPFQFKRPKSWEGISRWFLRKECVETALPLLNSNDSLFTIDTGYWTKTLFTFVNGKIRARGGVVSSFRKLGVFTIGKYYDVTIVVNQFIKQPLSSFAVTYDFAGTGVVSITETGTITVRILATTNDFTIDGVGGTANDSILIECIKINEYQIFNTVIGDIDLDKDLLDLINFDSNYDLIHYCGTDFSIQIPCGKYYMVIESASLIYYSESITVKDFIPSQSPYTMIEWTNSCDLSDVVYQPINGCSLVNRMYVDSELSNPEYPFTQEAEEDGNFNLNITFQKWEKKSNLLVASCPEFIVDALTGIKLHDSISITKSLRKKQIQTLPSFEIERIDYEIAPIFNECSTNVSLKLSLKDKFVDATCCENNILPSCITCDYTLSTLITNTFGDNSFGYATGNTNVFYNAPYLFGKLLPSMNFDLYEIAILFSYNTLAISSPGNVFVAGNQTANLLVGDLILVTIPAGGGYATDQGGHILTLVTYDAINNKTELSWSGIYGTFTPYYYNIKKITATSISTINTAVCVGGYDDYFRKNLLNEWYQTLTINVVDTDLGLFDHSYLITGNSYSGTFVQIIATITDNLIGIPYEIEYQTIYTATQLASGITLLSSDIGKYNDGLTIIDMSLDDKLNDNCTVVFKFKPIALNCTYPYSPTVTFDYLTGMHPIVQSWYDSLTVKLDSYTMLEINTFIEGLETDGILTEFDLLHIVAGLQTSEQRLKPLISTSGLNFELNGSSLIDGTGLIGNIADTYLNLKWKSVTDGVKYIDDDCSFGFFSSTDYTGLAQCDIGYYYAAVGSYIYAKTGTDAIGSINSGLNSSGAVSDSIGMYQMIGNSISEQKLYKGGLLLATVASPTGTMADEEFYLAARNNSGSADEFTERTYQFVFIGSSSINPALLNARFMTLKTTLGF